MGPISDLFMFGRSQDCLCKDGYFLRLLVVAYSGSCLSFSASQNVEETAGSIRHKNCPVSLHPCARDAYLLFQVNNKTDVFYFYGLRKL